MRAILIGLTTLALAPIQADAGGRAIDLQGEICASNGICQFYAVRVFPDGRARDLERRWGRWTRPSPQMVSFTFEGDEDGDGVLDYAIYLDGFSDPNGACLQGPAFDRLRGDQGFFILCR